MDSAVAERAALFWARLPANGRAAPGDILIAATAATRALVLITRDRRDFHRMALLDPELELADWSR